MPRRTPYYDKEGNQLSADQWTSLLGDPAYTVVAKDEIGPYTVITTWNGVDHNYRPTTKTRSGPRIFHCKVTGKDGLDRVTSTLASAVRNHSTVVNRLRKELNG